jgi:hypothetical protein
MKEQYVGDENDYRKYALLRHLAKTGRVRVGVCWMLTPPDDRSDGVKKTYLDKPNRWKHYDPDVFEELTSVRSHPGVRRLKLIERSGIIPKALFFNEHLSDRTDLRGAFFEAAWDHLKRAHLIFFDPDNGLDVKSRPSGRAGSSKYLFRSEVAETYKRGHSVLVYQHFRRVPLDRLVGELAGDLMSTASDALVWCFRTSSAAFLLLIHPDHQGRLTAAAERAPQHWRPRFIQGEQQAGNPR